MKKILLFVILISRFVSYVNAREYEPLLSDGKSWEIIRGIGEMPIVDDNPPICYTVDCDTIVMGKVCKKVNYVDVANICYSSAQGTIILLEEDKILYKYHDSFTIEDWYWSDEINNMEFKQIYIPAGFEPKIDFNLSSGDKTYGGKILADQIITDFGKEYRQIIINNNFPWEIGDSYVQAMWIEGVGTSLLERALIPNYYDRYFYYPTMLYDWITLNCKVNGEVIFDFTKYIERYHFEDTTSVKVNESEKCDSSYYDLTGIKVSKPIKGQLYIHDRKLVKY